MISSFFSLASFARFHQGAHLSSRTLFTGLIFGVLVSSCASTKDEKISSKPVVSDVATENTENTANASSPSLADAGVVMNDGSVLENGESSTSAEERPDLSKVSRKSPPLSPLQVFDRIIVKAKDEELDDDALRESAEKATGQKVVHIKHAALGIRLVQFAPLDPPRDHAAQQELVKVLQGVPSFKYVEGDRWLKAKDDE